MFSHKHNFQCFNTVGRHGSHRSSLCHLTRLPPIPQHGMVAHHQPEKMCCLCSEYRHPQALEAFETEVLPLCHHLAPYQHHPPHHCVHGRPLRSEEAHSGPEQHVHHHRRHSKRVVLVKNSDPSISKTIVLHRRSLRSLRLFLEEASELMQYHIRKLYTAEGHTIDSVQSLMQCPSILVCVGHEPFHPSILENIRRLPDDKLPEFNLRLPSNGCTEGYEDNANSCSPTGDGLRQDDIEKTVHVNKDGSLSMEMKVHFQLQNDETLHWSTKVKKIRGRTCQHLQRHNNTCFAQISQSYSESENISTGEQDASCITGCYKRHREDPHYPHCCVHQHVAHGVSRHIQTSSSSASSHTVVSRKTVTEKHIRSRSSEENVEQVEKETYIKQTVEAAETEDYCTIRSDTCSTKCNVQSTIIDNCKVCVVGSPECHIQTSETEEQAGSATSASSQILTDHEGGQNFPPNASKGSSLKGQPERQESTLLDKDSPMQHKSLSLTDRAPKSSVHSSKSRKSKTSHTCHCGVLNVSGNDTKGQIKAQDVEETEIHINQSYAMSAESNVSSRSKKTEELLNTECGDVVDKRSESAMSVQSNESKSYNNQKETKIKPLDDMPAESEKSEKSIKSEVIAEIEKLDEGGVDERSLSSMSSKSKASNKSKRSGLSSLPDKEQNQDEQYTSNVTSPAPNASTDFIMETPEASPEKNIQNPAEENERGMEERSQSAKSLKSEKSKTSRTSEDTFGENVHSPVSFKSNTSASSKHSKVSELKNEDTQERTSSAMSQKSSKSKYSEVEDPQNAAGMETTDGGTLTALSATSSNKAENDEAVMDTVNRSPSTMSVKSTKSNASTRSRQSITSESVKSEISGKSKSSAISSKSKASTDNTEQHDNDEETAAIAASTMSAKSAKSNTSAVSTNSSNISARSTNSKSCGGSDSAKNGEERGPSVLSVKSAKSVLSFKSSKSTLSCILNISELNGVSAEENAADSKEHGQRAPSNLSTSSTKSLKSNDSTISKKSRGCAIPSEIGHTASEKVEETEEKVTSSLLVKLGECSSQGDFQNCDKDNDNAKSAHSHVSKKSAERAPSAFSMQSAKSHISSKSKKSTASGTYSVKAKNVPGERDCGEETRESTASKDQDVPPSNMSIKSVKSVKSTVSKISDISEVSLDNSLDQPDARIVEGGSEGRAMSSMSGQTGISVVSNKPKCPADAVATEPSTTDKEQTGERLESSMSARSAMSHVSLSDNTLNRANSALSGKSGKSHASSKSIKSNASEVHSSKSGEKMNEDSCEEESQERVYSAMSANSAKSSISFKSAQSKGQDGPSGEDTSDRQEHEEIALCNMSVRSATSLKSNVSAVSKQSKASDIPSDYREDDLQIVNGKEYSESRSVSLQSLHSLKSSVSGRSNRSKCSSDDPDEEITARPRSHESTLSMKSNVSECPPYRGYEDVSQRPKKVNNVEHAAINSKQGLQSVVPKKSSTGKSSNSETKISDEENEGVCEDAEERTQSAISVESNKLLPPDISVIESHDVPDRRNDEDKSKRAKSVMTGKSTISLKSNKSKASDVTVDKNTNDNEKIMQSPLAAEITAVAAEEPDDRALTTMSSKSNVSARAKRSSASEVENKSEQQPQSSLSVESNLSMTSHKSKLKDILSYKHVHKKEEEEIPTASSVPAEDTTIVSPVNVGDAVNPEDKLEPTLTLHEEDKHKDTNNKSSHSKTSKSSRQDQKIVTAEVIASAHLSKGNEHVISHTESTESVLSQTLPSSDYDTYETLATRESNTSTSKMLSKDRVETTNIHMSGADNQSGKSNKCKQKITDADNLELVPSSLPNASPSEVVNEWLKTVTTHGDVHDIEELSENYDDQKNDHKTEDINRIVQNETNTFTADDNPKYVNEGVVMNTVPNNNCQPNTEASNVDSTSAPNNDTSKVFQSSVHVMKVLLNPKVDRCNSLPEISPVYGRKLSTSARELLDCLVKLQLINHDPKNAKNGRYHELMNILKSLWLCDPPENEHILKKRDDHHMHDEFNHTSSSGVDVTSGSTGSGKNSDGVNGEPHTTTRKFYICEGEQDANVQCTAEKDIEGIHQEKQKGDNPARDDTISKNNSPRELPETPPSLSKSLENDSSAQNAPEEDKRECQQVNSSCSCLLINGVHLAKSTSQDLDPVWVLTLLTKIEKQVMAHYINAMREFKVRWNLNDNEQLDTMIRELQTEVHKRIQTSINEELRKIQSRAGLPRPPTEAMSRVSTTQTEERRRRLKIMLKQSVDPQEGGSDELATDTSYSDQQSENDDYCLCETCIMKKMTSKQLPAEVMNITPIFTDFDLKRILVMKNDGNAQAIKCPSHSENSTKTNSVLQMQIQEKTNAENVIEKVILGSVREVEEDTVHHDSKGGIADAADLAEVGEDESESEKEKKKKKAVTVVGTVREKEATEATTNRDDDTAGETSVSTEHQSDKEEAAEVDTDEKRKNTAAVSKHDSENKTESRKENEDECDKATMEAETVDNEEEIPATVAHDSAEKNNKLASADEPKKIDETAVINEDELKEEIFESNTSKDKSGERNTMADIRDHECDKSEVATEGAMNDEEELLTPKAQEFADVNYDMAEESSKETAEQVIIKDEMEVTGKDEVTNETTEVQTTVQENAVDDEPAEADTVDDHEETPEATTPEGENDADDDVSTNIQQPEKEETGEDDGLALTSEGDLVNENNVTIKAEESSEETAEMAGEKSEITETSEDEATAEATATEGKNVDSDELESDNNEVSDEIAAANDDDDPAENLDKSVVENETIGDKLSKNQCIEATDDELVATSEEEPEEDAQVTTAEDENVTKRVADRNENGYGKESQKADAVVAGVDEDLEQTVATNNDDESAEASEGEGDATKETSKEPTTDKHVVEKGISATSLDEYEEADETITAESENVMDLVKHESDKDESLDETAATSDDDDDNSAENLDEIAEESDATGDEATTNNEFVVEKDIAATSEDELEEEAAEDTTVEEENVEESDTAGEEQPKEPTVEATTEGECVGTRGDELEEEATEAPENEKEEESAEASTAEDEKGEENHESSKDENLGGGTVSDKEKITYTSADESADEDNDTTEGEIAATTENKSEKVGMVDEGGETADTSAEDATTNVDETTDEDDAKGDEISDTAEETATTEDKTAVVKEKDVTSEDESMEELVEVNNVEEENPATESDVAATSEGESDEDETMEAEMDDGGEETAGTNDEDETVVDDDESAAEKGDDVEEKSEVAETTEQESDKDVAVEEEAPAAGADEHQSDDEETALKEIRDDISAKKEQAAETNTAKEENATDVATTSEYESDKQEAEKTDNAEETAASSEGNSAEGIVSTNDESSEETDNMSKACRLSQKQETSEDGERVDKHGTVETVPESTRDESPIAVTENESEENHESDTDDNESVKNANDSEGGEDSSEASTNNETADETAEYVEKASDEELHETDPSKQNEEISASVNAVKEEQDDDEEEKNEEPVEYEKAGQGSQVAENEQSGTEAVTTEDETEERETAEEESGQAEGTGDEISEGDDGDSSAAEGKSAGEEVGEEQTGRGEPSDNTEDESAQDDKQLTGGEGEENTDNEPEINPDKAEHTSDESDMIEESQENDSSETKNESEGPDDVVVLKPDADVEEMSEKVNVFDENIAQTERNVTQCECNDMPNRGHHIDDDDVQASEEEGEETEIPNKDWSGVQGDSADGEDEAEEDSEESGEESNCAANA